MPAQSLDEIVKEQAIQFADQIKQAAQFAEKEEEIRIAAERALGEIQRRTGITLRGRHEHTIGTGRADSVYGCVIIEYKNPHDPSSKLSSNRDAAGNQKVIEQIKKRFSDFKQEYNMPLNTMFGVGCDGNYFIFCRFRDEKWFIEDPVSVTKYSAERFLWALINMGTKGKAFSPEYLAGDFGSDSPLSHDGVRAIYDTICSTTSSKATVFFQQWKILFGEVCGYDVNTPSDKIKKLAEFYGIEDAIKPAELLFSIHTYYSIFMKLLASEIVAFFHKLPTPLQKILKAPTTNKLKEEMEDLERGSIFHHLNITNFLEGDLFAWYPDAWNDSFDNLIRDMANTLDGYNPGTLSEDPAGSRDLLKKLYQQLFPKSVRHDLGEYYTPDWLAEHVLNELEYEGDPDKRLLDPACGSGTFLVMTINKIRKWYDEHRDRCGYDEGGLARKILKNVIGFDLNPLAVMAARTNYLIAIKDLVGRVDEVEIPVYLCDSVITPSVYGGLDTWKADERIETKELKTSVANFKIPLEIAQDRQGIAKYAELLEFCIRNAYSTEEFIERCKNEGLSVTAKDLHIELYEELVGLDKNNKNGIWARIIKNAFAPLFSGRFDFVVGNPPWVVWDNLPKTYRNQIHPLMSTTYHLTMEKASSMKRLGQSKTDISMLFFYVGHDEYLHNSGKLGFVITQTLFQTTAGDGFRRFLLPDKTPISIKKVEDWVDVQPFRPKAGNKTSIIISIKNEKTFYPLPYIKWTPTRDLDRENSNLLQVFDCCHKNELHAQPSDSKNMQSFWIVGKSFDLYKKRGKYDLVAYKAREGISTALESAFRIKILAKNKDGTFLIENVIERAKKPMPLRQGNIEGVLIMAYVTGESIDRWAFTPRGFYVVTHTKETGIRPIDESTMKQKYSKAYSFLKQFKSDLENRSLHKRWGAKNPFYAMYNIGPYTFAPYRVAWKRSTKKFAAVVLESIDNNILGNVFVVPNAKVMFIPFDNEKEAHFFCSLINSSYARFQINRSITSEAHGDILDALPIPKYNDNDSLHGKLFKLSKQCHAVATNGDNEVLTKLEAEVDKVTARIWGITNDELDALQDALKEMQKPKTQKR